MTAAFAWPRRAGFLGFLAAFGVLFGLTGAYMPGEPEPRANILYNPSMEIDQANAGGSVSLASGANAFIVDGWSAGFHSASASVSAQQSSDAPPGFGDSLKVTVSTGASVGAGDYLFIRQPIEANELANLALGTGSAQSVCLSFWVKSSIGTYIFSAVLQNYAGTRSYPVNFTVASANTWALVGACFALDASGTWVTGGTAGGAYLIVTAAAGSTFQGTANSWTGSNLYGTSSDTNAVLSTTGATFQATGIKLEQSPVPTPFARRPFGQEVRLAQRYYEKTFALGTKPAQNLGTSTPGLIQLRCPSAGNYGSYFWMWKAEKRIPPTVTTYNPAAANANWREIGSSADVNAAVDPNGNVGTDGVFITTGPCNTTANYDAIGASADARLSP